MNFLKNIFSKPKFDLSSLISKGAVIIDVRTPQEFKNGHAANSVNIPLSEIKSRSKEIIGYERPVITCCRSGNRSGTAAKLLKQVGVEAYNGGSWQQVERASKK